jgi:CRISPR-associated RAMP protein (TIGR02581 family)
MFRTLYNQVKLIISIEPNGTPILIKTGREAFDPTRPDMEFVRTRTEFGEVPYLPGSSIKGVIRSHAERILRTICQDELRARQKFACDFVNPCVKSSGNRQHRYQEHCYACRTFGHTSIASRVRITDAYPWTLEATIEVQKQWEERVKLEERVGVMIGRRTGTVEHGPFFYEVVTEGTFYGEITVRNYQLWQLALLALVIRDINTGLQRLGAHKSRGLGKVQITVKDFEIQQLGLLAKDKAKLSGIGVIPNVHGSNDLIGDDFIYLSETLQEVPDTWWGVTFKPREGRTANERWEEVAQKLVEGKNWQNLLDKGRG